MRDRIWLHALLASALTFLATLFLAWQEVSRSGGASGGRLGVLGLLDVVAGSNSDGWTTQAGVVASLAALLLVLRSTGYPRPRASAFGSASTTSPATRP